MNRTLQRVGLLLACAGCVLAQRNPASARTGQEPQPNAGQKAAPRLANPSTVVQRLMRMTPEQRRELEEGIEQAERGQAVPAGEAFERLANRFGFSPC